VSRRRVLVVVQNISYTHDTRVRQIVGSLVAGGFDVEVVCPRMSHDPARDVRDGARIRFLRLPAAGAGLGAVLFEYACSVAILSVYVPWLCLRRRIGIVHLCMPPHVLAPLAGALRRLGRVVVVDQHDLMPELFDLRFGRRAGHRVRAVVRATERAALRAADALLVTNDTASRHAVDRCGVDADRVTVVRSGPDVGIVAGARPLPAPGRRVGFVGNIAPQDGVDHLVRAAAHVRVARGREDVSFVCVGDGSALDDARGLADDLGVADGIEFTGRLLHDEAMLRMAACDICVQPDRRNPFNDSCTMLKTLEYMALGKPVVAVDLAETRVSCGDAALYARDGSPEEFGELILRLVGDARLRARLGSEGHRRAHGELAWQHGERRLLEVYSRVAGRDAPPPRSASVEDVEDRSVEPVGHGSSRRGE
jgi:glycosyltransferase involved in cell wall biosynthesis